MADFDLAFKVFEKNAFELAVALEWKRRTEKLWILMRLFFVRSVEADKSRDRMSIYGYVIRFDNRCQSSVISRWVRDSTYIFILLYPLEEALQEEALYSGTSVVLFHSCLEMWRRVLFRAWSFHLICSRQVDCKSFRRLTLCTRLPWQFESYARKLLSSQNILSN